VNIEIDYRPIKMVVPDENNHAFTAEMGETSRRPAAGIDSKFTLQFWGNHSKKTDGCATLNIAGFTGARNRKRS
jgi:hypothetical protein